MVFLFTAALVTATLVTAGRMMPLVRLRLLALQLGIARRIGVVELRDLSLFELIHFDIASKGHLIIAP